MTDRGVSIDDPVNTAAHVATPEWQSFEQRMRRRRAERCIQHASEAIVAGRLDEASEALEEARQLDPLHDGLQVLSERLTATTVPLPPRSFVHDAAVIVPSSSPLSAHAAEPGNSVASVSFDELPVLGAPVPPPSAIEPLPGRPRSAGWRVAAVACLAIVTSAFAGWFAWKEWPSVPRADTGADIRLPLEIPPSLRFLSPSEGVPPEPVPASADASTVATTGAAEPIDESAVTLASGSPAATPQTLSSPVNEPTSSVAPAVRDDTAAASPPLRESASLPRVETPPVSPPAAARRSSAEDDSRTARPHFEPPSRVEEIPQPAAPLAAAVTPPALPPPAPIAAEETRAIRDEPVRPTAPVVDERVAIRSILSRYESAYSRLDAADASAIWPGVDGRALARAFESLDSQRVTLGSCDLGINGQTARASCSGHATWTPKVGGGSHTEARTWTFDLRRSDSGWQIVKVAAR